MFYFGFSVYLHHTPADLVVLSHLHLLLVASALEFLSSGQRTSAPSLCSFLGSAIMMVQMPYLSLWTLETPVLFGSSLNAAYHMVLPVMNALRYLFTLNVWQTLCALQKHTLTTSF